MNVEIQISLWYLIFLREKLGEGEQKEKEKDEHSSLRSSEKVQS